MKVVKTVENGVCEKNQTAGYRPDFPAARRRRQQRGGLFARRNAERMNREEMVQRAQFLPEALRAIVGAYYDRGVPMADLASLHNISVRQMRYKIEHLRGVLSDPSFLLAVHYGDHLPYVLAPIARGYWVQALTLRELAVVHGKSLHQVRTEIKRAQSLLVIAMAGELKVSADLASRVLH